MTLTELAKKIPAEYRKEILETNMIQRAIGIESDNSMFYLFTIWKQYVEPTIGNCNLCFQRVLENYRKLQQTFIELEQQSQLLKEA